MNEQNSEHRFGYSCICSYECAPTHERGGPGCEGNCFAGCCCTADVGQDDVLCGRCERGEHHIVRVPCDD